jgi:hypothetical protein
MAIKTLHITNWYHSTSGGIRTFYQALLEGANRLRRPMRLVVPGEQDGSEDVGEFGRIHYVRASRTPVFDRRYRLILPHTFLLPNSGGLRRVLQIERPDVVEVCDKYSVCWVAAALRRQWIAGVPRPTLVGISCERMDDNVAAYMTAAPLARRLAALYLGTTYVRLFDFHIAVSRYVADELTGCAAALGDRLTVLPMGVQIEGLGAWNRDRDLGAQLQKASGGNGATALLL